VPTDVKSATCLGAGDVITSIAGERHATITSDDGAKRTVGVHVWRAAKQVLDKHVNETVEIKYKALGDNEEHVVTYRVAPGATDPWMMRVNYAQAVFGIGPYPTMTKLVARNPIDALWIGMRKTGYVITTAYLTFQRMVIDRTVGVENISGPVGIVKAGTSFLDAGFVKLLYFMALISANLAVINFLPLPIVDGGLFVFLIIEKIKGSPISLKTQVATQIIGLALIIAVFLFVTIMDISKL
jgi:RIP metalloprotease RseP